MKNLLSINNINAEDNKINSLISHPHNILSRLKNLICFEKEKKILHKIFHY